MLLLYILFPGLIVMIMTMWQVDVSGEHKRIRSNTFFFTGMCLALLYIRTICKG